MESHGWINVGYAQKSRTNEPVKNKIKPIQKMTDFLLIKCHCAKVFLSPPPCAPLDRNYANMIQSCQDWIVIDTQSQYYPIIRYCLIKNVNKQ
ncbi:hypothetical protein PHYBLDRAFT_157504 [Phycomyces blakesleeanus NRRL 1555(-)]|uniref:Uncharacterized protein n=2 Tax=Phycomyces blakesleeanus TaxID=4837 RepID=A0A163EEN2_PHYB8|nr:hypothetical protein PHYBLDRAFT_157504 [Phycomyces blakesleeanus NRRL 1555(-)]OAD78260.1 hypothetical protein PHYBLDRAFT_157504 [Phycomyces blakesleeanus NRRL 1555(-)]|eukprot:XP_018296300.1 hypothetical protein PHYBLDRAFT_157504 [Phycomyces blakesleeanus NRRL 1555(-)]